MLTKFRKNSTESVHKETRGIRWYLNLGLFFCVTSYVALSPALFYKLFEFVPSKYDATQYQVADKIAHEDVHISLYNGKTMHGWYFPSPNAKHTVIVHHGQGNNVAFYFETAEVFHSAGANVLLYDYEGFGRSDGPTNHESLRRDAEAAYWYVRKTKSIPANQIVHCGLSLGSGAAADIAARQPCEGAFLCSAYWRASDVAKNVVPILRMYPEAAFPQPDVGAAQLAKTNIPVLIINGDNDPLMPKSGAEQIYKLAKGQKQLIMIANGHHVGGPVHGTEDFVQKWLSALPKQR